MTKIALLSCLLPLGMTACVISIDAGSMNCPAGSETGPAVTVERTSIPFTKINYNGGFPLQIKIAQGPPKVVIEAQQSLEPKITTHVVDETLIISPPSNYCTTKKLSITLYTPPIQEIVHQGSGDIEGELPSVSHLRLIVTGMGNLSISGQSKTLFVKHQGMNKLNLQHFTTGTTEIDHDSSQELQLCVTGDINGSVSGSGDVEITCNPRSFQLQKSGFGNLKIENIQGQKGKLQVDGMGKVTLQGSLAYMWLDHKGNHSIEANELQVQKIEVFNHASGDIQICPTSEVIGILEGFGNVELHCQPQTSNLTKKSLGDIKIRY